MDKPTLSRRSFLIASTSAGLVFGFAAVAHSASAFAPTIWYSMAPDGVVTVNIIRAEMGQHVGTSLARILADELEVEWNKIRIKHVDTDPKWGLMVTGGSWSVWQTFPIFNQAGAAGRITLIEAGAKLLGVSSADCKAQNGVVIGGGNSFSYSEIIARGDISKTYTEDELKKLPIKPATERRFIGKPVTAIDIQEKTNGTAIY